MSFNPTKDFLFQDKGMYKIVLGFDEDDIPKDFDSSKYKDE